MKRLTLFLLALTVASQGWGQVQMDRIAPKGINGTKYVSISGGCGGVNDVTAVQNALNSSAGNTLLITSNTNCANNGSATWTVPDNTTIQCTDQTAKFTLTSNGVNFPMFTFGNNVQFIGCKMVSTAGFNASNLSYALWWTGKNNITIKDVYCTGFDFACIQFQDSLKVRISNLVCDSNGSMNDGSGHHEGRCISISTTGATASKDVVFDDITATANGGFAIISDGSVGVSSCGYSLDGFTFKNLMLDGNGDSGLQLNNAQNGTVSGTSNNNGQNPITRFGEGFHTFGISNNGSRGCPDNHITFSNAVANGNQENGFEMGFGSNNSSITSCVSTNNGSSTTGTGYGVKISDQANDLLVSGCQISGNFVSGIAQAPTIFNASDGVTNGTTTFTSASIGFNSTTAKTCADNACNIVIQNGNTGSVVYIGTIAHVVNNTTVTLASPAPTSSSSGLTFWYGVFQQRHNIVGNQVHDNGQTGIDIVGFFDTTVQGNLVYNNGQRVSPRYGIACSIGKRCIVKGNTVADYQASPTQQYGVFGFAVDTLAADLNKGTGNALSLTSFTNGSSVNTSTFCNTIGPCIQYVNGTAGCVTNAASVGSVCTTAVTVTWPTPFLDTNYSARCIPSGAPSSGQPSAPYIASKTASAITFNYFNNTATTSQWSTVDCEARHIDN